jgi:pSer/pThr/pTyr-binding forkhead associated (FHA) protein
MEPDDSGDTQAGGFVPSHAAHDEPAPPTTRPVARLIFSSGEVVEVDRPVVVGRSPEARRYGDDEARLVAVPSPHQEISSTHLEIRPGSGADHGSAVATDLGSTNGTVVAQPGLPAEDLQPGIAVSLVPGAIIDLGEGVTIQVTGT